MAFNAAVFNRSALAKVPIGRTSDRKKNRENCHSSFHKNLLAIVDGIDEPWFVTDSYGTGN
jgi:hypothetical protein